MPTSRNPNAPRPVWDEWVAEGKLPELPEDWKWGRWTLHLENSDMSINAWGVGKITQTVHTKNQWTVLSIPWPVVVAIVEARRVWQAAGGVF